MRISKVTIHNFASIKELSVQCAPRVVLLGPNNHGKSNILSAIDFFLSASAKIDPETYFKDREDDDLWVEIEFENLTEQEKTTFKRYNRQDGSIRIRKTATNNSGKIEYTYNGYIQVAEEWWLHGDDDIISKLAKREEVEKTPLKNLLPESGKITKSQIKEAQEKYITENSGDLRFSEKKEDSSLLGAKNIAPGVLPEFYLIPAVKDLTDETKIKSGTTLGRLLNRAVQEMAETDPRFDSIRKELEGLVSSLKGASAEEASKTPLAKLERDIEKELSAWGVGVEIEITPPAIEKIFELGTALHIDDGTRTVAERKGHGLQRAIIFAMIRAWAASLRKSRSEESPSSARKASESVLFGMEEPELFLHPHAQRRLSKALSDIADISDHQVFLCTHSTHFVDLDKYKEIVVVSKPSSKLGTKINQCSVELFGEDEQRAQRFHMAKWINPDRAEMFFARKVVFVEGETEHTLLPYLAEKLGIFDPDISIIDCGSKFNIRLYIEIANAFKLKYAAVYDEDPVPDVFPVDWNEDKKNSAKRTFQENNRILGAMNLLYGEAVTIVPNFEEAAGISIAQGKRKGKTLAALDFFSGKQAEDISAKISTAVRAIYKK